MNTIVRGMMTFALWYCVAFMLVTLCMAAAEGVRKPGPAPTPPPPAAPDPLGEFEQLLPPVRPVHGWHGERHDAFDPGQSGDEHWTS